MFEYMFIPVVVFLVIVAPLWIVMHYVSTMRSRRGLNREDKLALEQLLSTIDGMSDRIATLEAILDQRHGSWRGDTEHSKGEANE